VLTILTLVGTSPDLTVPPATGSPAQASSKALAPLDQQDGVKAATALASRRESTTTRQTSAGLSKSQKEAEKKAEEDEVKLKEFVQDDRHFSLVRYVLQPLYLSCSPPLLLHRNSRRKVLT
jgi:CDP-diacylglycerol--serine O-phosphatidyltransferase